MLTLALRYSSNDIVSDEEHSMHTCQLLDAMRA